MKKELLLCLVASTLLLSCNGKNNNSQDDVSSLDSESLSSDVAISSEISSEYEEDIDYYAVVNSYNDTVYLYGVIGETFELKRINSSRCTKKKLTYEVKDDCCSVNDGILTFNKKGTCEIVAKADNAKQFSIQVSVNESDDSRYSYPYDIDLNDFNRQSALTSEVKIENDSITMVSSGSAWNRITYDLDEAYSKNYSIECDATFLTTSDPSRWLGVVFRDNENRFNKFPYYQFDFRQNTALSNAVEVTYVYDTSSYSYPYIGTWDNGNPGILKNSDKVHVKIEVFNSNFKGTLTCGSYSKEVIAKLPTSVGGNIGFQCAGSTVKFENIKVTLDERTIKVSNADTELSKVNMEENTFDLMKPFMIASGTSIDEIFGVNVYGQEYFVKAKGNELYNINNEKMDVNLNGILYELCGLYIPNIQIEDEETLQEVVEVCTSFGIIDLAIWSTKGEILDLAMSMMPYARTGYIPTNVKSFETYDEIGSVCREAGNHYANMILLDSSLLNKENIIKATGLGYTIVADAKNGDNYSVISSALAGCKLILANFNDNVQTQTNLIYDDDAFNVDVSSSNSRNHVHSLLSTPFATGHRGAGTNGTNPDVTLPENTVASYEWAYANGAQAIEIDIHTTLDNRLAVIHNATTGEYSNVDISVKGSKLSQLQSIPLKVGAVYSKDYHIPSLEEVFTAFSSDEYKEKAMVIEVKDNLTSTGKAAIQMAKEMGWYNRISLITFNAATAQELKTYDPGVQVGYLNTVVRHTNTEYWISSNSYLSLGVGLASQFTTISTEPLQESNARGQMYWLWTFNRGDHAQLLQHIFDGNRAYTTNYLGFFKDNKYKLDVEAPMTLSINESKSLSAVSTTYKQTKNNETDIEIIVLSDNAAANKNTITRTGNGDIYAIAKCKTTWKTGDSSTNFYIYSDVIVIK